MSSCSDHLPLQQCKLQNIKKVPKHPNYLIWLKHMCSSRVQFESNQQDCTQVIAFTIYLDIGLWLGNFINDIYHLESNTCASFKVKTYTTLRSPTHPRHLHVESQAPRMVCTTTRSNNYVSAMKHVIANKAAMVW
jgi:hypothetical protein